MNKTKIFISHAKEDNELVRKIMGIFDEYDVDYWVDLEQLGEGDSNVVAKINDELEDVTFFLLLWSSHAKESTWVKREHNVATSGDYDKRLRKIILRTDDANLPPLLAPLKYHRVTIDSIDSVMKGIMKMIKDDFKTQIKFFREKVIDDYEKFPKEPIISNLKKFNAFKYYVQQPFRKLSRRDNLLDNIATTIARR